MTNQATEGMKVQPNGAFHPPKKSSVAMHEYVNMLTVSCIATLLFFGGWNAPFGWTFIPSVAWFVIKVASFMFFYMWLRATLPRLRYDRLMAFGWKFLLPVAMLNLVVTAVIVAYK